MGGGEQPGQFGVVEQGSREQRHDEHGTHDTRKIGRRSSDGCIGLFNSAIAELFDVTPIAR